MFATTKKPSLSRDWCGKCNVIMSIPRFRLCLGQCEKRKPKLTWSIYIAQGHSSEAIWDYPHHGGNHPRNWQYNSGIYKGKLIYEYKRKIHVYISYIWDYSHHGGNQPKNWQYSTIQVYIRESSVRNIVGKFRYISGKDHLGI